MAGRLFTLRHMNRPACPFRNLRQERVLLETGAMLLAVLLGLSGCGKKAAAPPAPPVPVTTAWAVTKPMPLVVEAMGSVET